MKNKIYILLSIGLLLTSLFGCVVTPNDNNQDNTNDGCEYHVDDDRDNICDVCQASLGGCEYHMDDDRDGICDVCEANLVETDYTADGIYSLDVYTVFDTDLSNIYYSNYLILKEGKVTWVKTDVTGSSLDEGTYVKEDNVLTITIGIKPYNFIYDEQNSSIKFEGTLNKEKVVMTYSVKEDFTIGTDTGDVNFIDELFGDDINENFYNYCPTIMVEGNDTMHIWYCSNEKSGNVTDFIAYRKGKLSSDGKWSFSEKQLVLGPTSGTWDGRHVCDPSVVKGEFNYNGETYNYLMAYLGCKTSDVTSNEVGIAVAKNPEGPWVKYDANPICNYYESTEFAPGENFWGYGQPSVISVDKAGKVILFYTKGIKIGTYTYAEYWDLSDLNNPVKLNGAKMADGGEIGYWNNADFAYDSINKRIYVIKEDHSSSEWYPNSGGVNWISGSNSIFYAPMNLDDTYPGETLFGKHNWSKVTTIGEAQTGFARVHNAGIMTDEYGWLVDSHKIPVVYTMSDLKTDHPDWSLGGQWPALHTYRLHGYVVSL